MSNTVQEKFEELITIVKRLKAPDGCPWDREQTNASLLPYFLEEAYEVIESVDNENWFELKEELGDILLHVIFQAVLAEENGHFNINDSLDNVNEKLVRRDRKSFGDARAEKECHTNRNWEAENHKEKKGKSE